MAALRQLYKDGASSAGALMDALGMTKGAVSKVVTRLQEKGLVERSVAGADRRAQQIVLTQAGRALVPALAALADENDAAFFGHLTPAQRRALVALMRNIVRTHGLTQLPVE